MGQAKQRGTFEQRQAEGIAKRQEQERKRADALAARRVEQAERDARKTPEERKRADALAARRVEQAERDARKTPEERDRSQRAAMLLTSVLGLVVSSSMAKGVEIARMAAEYRDR